MNRGATSTATSAQTCKLFSGTWQVKDETSHSAPTERGRPMIDVKEVRHLASLYGIPVHGKYDLQAGGSILKHRWRKDVDRRAEVVFAIQGPGEQIWLHTKHQYQRPTYRLPSGGIELHESVVDAMLREVDEETGLVVEVMRFVALMEYTFHRDDSVAHFASYLFLLKNRSNRPRADGREVANFRSILPSQLPHVAANLRNIIGERRYWGHWRALPHDILYETLNKR